MVSFMGMDKQEVTTNEIMEVLQKQQSILLKQQDEIKGVSDILKRQDNDHTELMGFLEEHMVTKEEFHGLETRVGGIETKVDKLDDRVDSLEVKVNQVKLDLLDAMDEKLGSLKGDLVIMMRGEDQKLMYMAQKLRDKKVFDSCPFEFTAPFPPKADPPLAEGAFVLL